MLTRLQPVLFFVLGLTAASLAWAQVVEEDDTEILKAVPRTVEPANTPELDGAVQKVLASTNRFRDEEGREKVAVNPSLRKAAQYFADYMARTNRYGHKADGERPADRAKKFGYQYCIVAENIAYAYSSEGFTTDELAAEFFEGWKASPGHRRNMLDRDVTETALAISQGNEGGYVFAVQMFGRPRSQALEFTIANESEQTVEYKLGERTLSLAPGHVRTHQVCRPRDLAFRWDGAEGTAQTVQPKDGERFVITGSGDSLELRRE